MNPQLTVQILIAILSVFDAQLGGKSKTDAELADLMLMIAQKAALAYQQQSGRPLDPSLILQEAAI